MNSINEEARCIAAGRKKVILIFEYLLYQVLREWLYDIRKENGWIKGEEEIRTINMMTELKKDMTQEERTEIVEEEISRRDLWTK